MAATGIPLHSLLGRPLRQGGRGSREPAPVTASRRAKKRAGHIEGFHADVLTACVSCGKRAARLAARGHGWTRGEREDRSQGSWSTLEAGLDEPNPR